LNQCKPESSVVELNKSGIKTPLNTTVISDSKPPTKTTSTLKATSSLTSIKNKTLGRDNSLQSKQEIGINKDTANTFLDSDRKKVETVNTMPETNSNYKQPIDTKGVDTVNTLHGGLSLTEKTKKQDTVNSFRSSTDAKKQMTPEENTNKPGL